MVTQARLPSSKHVHCRDVRPKRRAQVQLDTHHCGCLVVGSSDERADMAKPCALVNSRSVNEVAHFIPAQALCLGEGLRGPAIVRQVGVVNDQAFAISSSGKGSAPVCHV